MTTALERAARRWKGRAAVVDFLTGIKEIDPPCSKCLGLGVVMKELKTLTGVKKSAPVTCPICKGRWFGYKQIQRVRREPSHPVSPRRTPG